MRLGGPRMGEQLVLFMASYFMVRCPSIEHILDRLMGRGRLRLRVGGPCGWVEVEAG